MGDPFTVDLPTGCVLHICCCYQRACSAMVQVVGTIWSVGLLVPSISVAGKASLTSVCQLGNGRANCAGVTAARLGFLDPLCGIIPPTS